MQLSQKQLPASRAHIMRLRCWTQLASIHMGLLVPKWIPQAGSHGKSQHQSETSCIADSS